MVGRQVIRKTLFSVCLSNNETNWRQQPRNLDWLQLQIEPAKWQRFNCHHTNATRTFRPKISFTSRMWEKNALVMSPHHPFARVRGFRECLSGGFRTTYSALSVQMVIRCTFRWLIINDGFLPSGMGISLTHQFIRGSPSQLWLRFSMLHEIVQR